MGWTDWLTGGGAQGRADQRFVTGQVRSIVPGLGGRQAPTMQAAPLGASAAMNTSLADQFRARQMGLADRLGRIETGQQAGAGELAARRMGESAAATAAGTATMARGAGAAGARQAARAVGAIGLQTSGQAQQAAMGDQAQARAGLASLLASGRDADLMTAGANQQASNQFTLTRAGMDQQARQANLAAQLQQMGMNDAQTAALLGLLSGQGVAQAQDRGAIGGLLSTGGQLAGQLWG